MSDALVPVITRAGLTAAVAANNAGLKLALDRVVVGRGINVGGTFVGYTPDKAQTALRGETSRVPILSGSSLDIGFRILAQVPSSTLPTEYAIREVGFLTEEGILFAVWSSPAFVLAYKTALADIDFSLDLFLEQVPVGSLTLKPTEPDIPDTTGVLAGLLSCTLRTLIADLTLERRAAARGIY